MRLWVGIVLTGTVLLTVLTALAAGSAEANDREAADGFAERRGAGADAASWRILDQPRTRWGGDSGGRVAAAPTAGPTEVLPLGAGLTCLGLGIGLVGYHLRQS
ncbi:hypothetical protein RM844_12145 [Streptomyces sp. DSM 44915]|uniref:LPXTG cell wall anchor domain-containing protein n=1 Tax=Streptomyces chisholmiae TaxID=3075540 RepID=A0ABU2JPX0_9ACTN|nr:hypothetical protein [Streptomyces sp. DSM 44915]MDT0267040.1 hypothetical protein [Streptomyces sp. DSM 44915]